MKKEEIREFYDRTAGSRAKWKRRNRFYHASLQKYFSYIIAEKSRVLEVGCGLGDLLAAMNPEYGVGIDIAPNIIEQAKQKYPDLHFYTEDAENLTIRETFDYIILSDLAGCLWDVQHVFNNIRKLCHPQTRIVISNYNYLWEGIMTLG
ncbi:MAG: class I SAM-dependent methyltransferase, partial [Bacteroidetes bacterium]|nr:class I SAM-dependent methyltransferase [Bacteroidota bacterium]